jgi:hypothetical protein
MRLMVAHKILIGSTIGLMVVLAATRFVRYGRTHDGGALAVGVAALVAMPALALYLRRIWDR